jgi:PEGA domain
MKTHMMSRALEIVVVWTLLSTSTVSSQMPARAVGKLVITSTTPGATIVINGKVRTEVTPVTLLVSPGMYKVKIGNCDEQTVQVSSGDPISVNCPK